MTGISAYESYYPSSAGYKAQGGLAETARSGTAGSGFRFSDLYKQETLPHSPVNTPSPVDPTMWEKFKSGVSNYGKDADGKYSAQGTPLARDLTAVGGLGLGVASFLEQRKTAGLQREALRHDIATAKEHRANRQALGDSWNRAWSK